MHSNILDQTHALALLLTLATLFRPDHLPSPANYYELPMDEAALFEDSDDDEQEDQQPAGVAGTSATATAPTAAKKKTPEERKFIFRKELRSMLYGFGDDKVGVVLLSTLLSPQPNHSIKNPSEQTLDALEQIVIDYIRQVCEKCLQVGKPNRLTLEDIHYLIRRDAKKFARVKELLSMHDELKKARKAFDDVKEI